MYLAQVTGFKSSAPVISVICGGTTFYYFENPQEKEVFFNLPANGQEYIILDDEVEKLKRPINYICPPLPKREKNITIPLRFNVSVGPNPHKASVEKLGDDTNVLIDESFIDNPCELVFILFHEYGHHYYFEEWKCDVFAAKNMLERGYNPSQCYYSSALCLSDRKPERKVKLYKYLEQVKYEK